MTTLLPPGVGRGVPFELHGPNDIPLSDPIVDRLDELFHAERRAAERALYALVPEAASLPDAFVAILIGDATLEAPPSGAGGWKFTSTRAWRVLPGVTAEAVENAAAIFERMRRRGSLDALHGALARGDHANHEVELLWVRRNGDVVPELVASYLGHPLRS